VSLHFLTDFPQQAAGFFLPWTGLELYRLGVEFAWSREDLDVEGPIQSYSIIPAHGKSMKIMEIHGNEKFTGSSFDFI